MVEILGLIGSLSAMVQDPAFSRESTHSLALSSSRREERQSNSSPSGGCPVGLSKATGLGLAAREDGN